MDLLLLLSHIYVCSMLLMLARLWSWTTVSVQPLGMFAWRYEVFIVTGLELTGEVGALNRLEGLE